MNKILKNTFLLIAMLMLKNIAIAQKKRKVIHFLADTVNVDLKNRIVEIGKEGTIQYYAFYCKCISPYNSIVSFTYSNKGAYLDIKNTIPDYDFITWKDFSEIISNEGNNLSKNYLIYITEILPDSKYKTNIVNLVVRKQPSIDYQIIRSKNN